MTKLAIGIFCAVLGLSPAAAQSPVVESAFTSSFAPDILGISGLTTAREARPIYDKHFAGRQLIENFEGQAKLYETAPPYVSYLLYSTPEGPTGSERLNSSYSSAETGNRLLFLTRVVSFREGKQPDVLATAKALIDKYGPPTLVGNSGLEWFFRGHQVVKGPTQHTHQSIAKAMQGSPEIDDVIKLDVGSCRQGLGDVTEAGTSLGAQYRASKKATCDGMLSVGLFTSSQSGLLLQLSARLVDFKRIASVTEIDIKIQKNAEEERRKALPRAPGPKL